MIRLGLARGLSRILGVVFVLGLLGGAALAVSGRSPEQIKKICDKAEARYQKIFGKPSTSEDVKVVLMYKYTFCPGEVTIKQGESVRWVNVDYTSHSTWFKEAGKEESARLFRKESSEMKFDLPPGEYPYLCGPHWESDGMIGKVEVTE